MSVFSNWKNYCELKGCCFENEPVMAFIMLWMCYNQYYNRYHKKYERERACELSKNRQMQNIYQGHKLKILQEFSKIPYGTETRKFVQNPLNGKAAMFNEEKWSLKDFLNVVYQIRCNLFHGEKTPYSNDTDVTLIKWAYDNLYLLLHEYKRDLF